MRRMLIYLLIGFSGFFTGITFSQNLTLTKVGEWGTAPYMDVFVQGNYAYCATGKAGLEIFDITNPANPVKTGRCDTPGYAMDVYVNGNCAYVGDDENGLQIIDISNPIAPAPVGNYPTIGSAYDVFVSGNYAYVADSGGELKVLDVSIPSSPNLIATYNTLDSPVCLWLKGDYVYLLDRSTGMHVINISVPSAPTQVGNITISPHSLSNFKMHVCGNYAYVGDYSHRLVIIDISNPSAPTLAGTYGYEDDVEFWAIAVNVSGNYAYTAGGSGRLKIIDVSNPSAIFQVGSLVIPGDYPVGIHVVGNYAYMAANNGGIAVIDVSIPSSPTLAGNYDDAVYPRRVHVNGNHAYVIDFFDTMKVIDVSVPSSPIRVGNYDAFETVSSVETAGNYAYTVSREGSFHIIDISNPSSPSLVGSTNPNAGSLTDVFVKGNYAYLLSGYWGLRVIDISVPSSPALVGSYDIHPSNAYLEIRDIHVSGNYAYIAPENSILYIMDVSLPSAPAMLADFSTPNIVSAVYVSGNYAYVAASSDGLYILDVSSPSSPSLVGNYDTPGEVFDVYVSGNYAYVADYKSGVQMIDISDPSAPTLAASYDTPGTTTGVFSAGNYVYAADDDSGKLIILAATDPSNTPQISLNRSELYFGADGSGTVTGAQSVLVENSGTGNLNWTASVDRDWLKCSHSSGGNTVKIWVSVDETGLAPGTYTGAVTVSDPLAINSPRTVAVTLKVYQTNSSSPPFGVFSTPVDGSTVSSSIPVTGWVLDDIGVHAVQLFRQAGNSRDYIGEAILVESARPDVELAYPGYPMNYKAGWGYMMLTNFLVGGDGDFTIIATVTDVEGNQVTLGTKRITVDNTHAVKPFGAIDTPAQGGTASGSNFINWGWVLTPQPNGIPTDGSTIFVYVDGVNLGHPSYNKYRGDIASLFPDYANSNGAAGYFYLDTTGYENGVHTIQWIATDDAGNTDGIGSRYFTIQNTGGAARLRSFANRYWSMGNEKFNRIPINDSEPVILKKGYQPIVKINEIFPDDNGIINIEIMELEPVEIKLEGTRGLAPLSNYTGFLVINDCFRLLPIGSTLDTKRGIFSWMPGVGFFGTYEFIFIRADANDRRKIRVRIKILPKYSIPLE